MKFARVRLRISFQQLDYIIRGQINLQFFAKDAANREDLDLKRENESKEYLCNIEYHE